MASLSLGCGPTRVITSGDVVLPVRPASDRGILDVVDLVDAPDGVSPGRGEIVLLASQATFSSLSRSWGHPEKDTNVGVSFRWATATEVEVFLPVVYPGHETFVLHCRPFNIPGPQQQTVEVTVGETILGTLELQRGFRRYQLPVPPGALSHGNNTVRLRFAYAEPPARYFKNSPDRRNLAAAVVSLGFASSIEEVDSLDFVDGPDIVVPPGSTARTRLKIPRGAVVELSAAPSRAGGSVWLRHANADHIRLIEAKEETDQRWQIDLDQLAGEVVEIGFSNPADARDPARWVRPQLRSRAKSFDPSTHVILIVVDTLRADFVGCYGGASATPNIDRLATEGVRFSRAYAHIPITGPSHASMFTGRLPFEHGVRNNTQILPRQATTMAETLREHYRETAGFISLGVLQRRYGFHQGFTTYGQTFAFDWFKTATEVNDDVLQWLESRKRSVPSFLFVHYSDPHEPYAPPGLNYPQVRIRTDDREVTQVTASGRTAIVPISLRGGRKTLRIERFENPLVHPIRFRNWETNDSACVVVPGSGFTAHPDHSWVTTLPAEIHIDCAASPSIEGELRFLIEEALPLSEARKRYGQEVEAVDTEIGRLVAALKTSGMWDHSLVIFTSDHGEGLGDHQLLGHISQLYDTLIHVPLILVAPGRIPAGREVASTVRHIDLLPTILDALTIDLPADLSGSSLFPVIEDANDRDLIAATYRTESSVDLHGVVRGDYKYIRNLTDGSEELYRLADDPGELNNLVQQEPEVAARLRAWLEENVNEDAARAESAEIDDEERARLRALGYVH